MGMVRGNKQQFLNGKRSTWLAAQTRCAVGALAAAGDSALVSRGN